MKKILIFILFIVVSTFVFAQQKYGDDMDGTDWNNFSREFKIGYIMGAANTTLGLYNYFDYLVNNQGRIDYTIAYNDIKNIYLSTFTKFSYGTIVSMMDDYYRNPKNITVKLSMAIFACTDM